MPSPSPSLPCGEIRSQVDVNFAVTVAVAVAAWTFPCRKFNLTMKEENKTTTICACEEVDCCASESAIAVRCFGWSASQRLRRAQKIQGNAARRRLRSQGDPHCQRQRSREGGTAEAVCRTQPPIAAILKRAQHISQRSQRRQRSHSSSSRNNVAASVRAVRSFAIGRCTRSVQSNSNLT